MNIKIVTDKITKAEALEIGKEFYDDMVKGVVDLRKEIVALGGEYHIDANEVLIRSGSRQDNLWGFNLYPNRSDADWIEYKSLINIRPKLGNRSLLVEDEGLRLCMRNIIENKII